MYQFVSWRYLCGASWKTVEFPYIYYCGIHALLWSLWTMGTIGLKFPGTARQFALYQRLKFPVNSVEQGAVLRLIEFQFMTLSLLLLPSSPSSSSYHQCDFAHPWWFGGMKYTVQQLQRRPSLRSTAVCAFKSCGMKRHVWVGVKVVNFQWLSSPWTNYAVSDSDATVDSCTQCLYALLRTAFCNLML